MPGFPLLDVAIGLIFVYLLLSLICSSLSEGLESILRNRATDLEFGIRNLLGDKPGNWWASFLPRVNSIAESTITREFYGHPLIQNLFLRETALPSYIPARNFALAVMDLAVKDGALLLGATRGAALNSAAPGAAAPPPPMQFVDKIGDVAVPDQLKKSVAALVTAARSDAQQARLNIENWFNSSMDRVSGGYKSRTQKILFCLGVAVTVLVNADSIEIFQHLSHSKNLETIVGAAVTAAGGKLPSGQDPQAEIAGAMEQLNKLDTGMGWTGDARPPGESRFDWGLHLLFIHGVGWLITAAAIALGAPFWFDTLNRFIVVRSTVKPQEKSRDEGSKD